MAAKRVKCAECENMILPETAAANGGLCAPCAKTPEPLRRALREHEAKLASGSWFVPSDEERGAAMRPAEFDDPSVVWNPQPEYYKDKPIRSAQDVVDLAAGDQAGHAFLVSDRGGVLSFAFNERFGVCEYDNESTGDDRYAYTPENLTAQVDADLHLAQACPCCGVALLMYPSRFHMPRPRAFALFAALALGRPSGDADSVEWLDCGDISYTEHGRG